MLIVQSVLFTGIVILTARLGPLFTHADSTSRKAIAIELGVALAFFLASIACLLLAAAPHRPSRGVLSRHAKGEASPREFLYPEPGSLLDEVNDSANVDDEAMILWGRYYGLDVPSAEYGLAYEQVKIQNVQLKEARFAQCGAFLLFFEIVAVVGYLLTIGNVALERYGILAGGLGHLF